MKKMKQTLILALALTLIAAVTGCSKNNDSSNPLISGTQALSYHVKMGTKSNSSLPRCLNLTTGQLYSWSDATANSSLIDLVSDIYANEVDCEGPATVSQITAWTRRKSTFFSNHVSGMDLTAFNNIQTVGQVTSFCTSNDASYTSYWESGIGKVFTIRTYENKLAVVRVSNTQGSDNDAQGFIELDVKVAP